MVSVERKLRLYESRKEGCGLKNTLSQNRNYHEKVAGHKPPKAREVGEPLCAAHLKLFNYRFSNS